MCRSLVNVEPKTSGWQVSIKGTPIMTHAGELEAITAASDFARMRHEATGEPTGVWVQMRCGEAVLLAAHG
jgi:hypothetical protein